MSRSSKTAAVAHNNINFTLSMSVRGCSIPLHDTGNSSAPQLSQGVRMCVCVCVWSGNLVGNFMPTGLDWRGRQVELRCESLAFCHFITYVNKEKKNDLFFSKVGTMNIFRESESFFHIKKRESGLNYSAISEGRLSNSACMWFLVHGWV